MSRKKINDGLTKWKRWAINHLEMARASYLAKDYRREDKKRNRGKCTLTAQWIYDNILFKPCAHCGKEGWDIIGCNRLDNSKPHTVDNVEPCCKDCNTSEWIKTVEKPIDQINPITGEVLKTWKSSSDARRNGFNTCYKVANGLRNQNKGYVWKYWA